MAVDWQGVQGRLNRCLHLLWNDQWPTPEMSWLTSLAKDELEALFAWCKAVEGFNDDGDPPDLLAPPESLRQWLQDHRFPDHPAFQVHKPPTVPQVVDLLSLVDSTPVSAEFLQRCSDEQLAEIADWAVSEHLAAGDHDIQRKPRPLLLERHFPRKSDVLGNDPGQADSLRVVVGCLLKREGGEWKDRELEFAGLPDGRVEVLVPDGDRQLVINLSTELLLRAVGATKETS